jgi:hypothetical protein
MTKDAIFVRLVSMGADKAVVKFSGGGDEGFAQDPELYKDNVLLSRWSIDVDKDELGRALAKPIFDQFGSFAGDFSVYGACIWTVADKKIMMSYDESEYVHHDVDVLGL